MCHTWMYTPKLLKLYLPSTSSSQTVTQWGKKLPSFTVPFFRTVILLLQQDDTTNQPHKVKHILCTWAPITTRLLLGFWQRFLAGCNSAHHRVTFTCGNMFILGMKCKFGLVYTHNHKCIAFESKTEAYSISYSMCFNANLPWKIT